MDKFLTTHHILVCFILGMFGGIVKYLDLSLREKIPINRMSGATLMYRAVVAGFCSLAFTLLVIDVDKLTTFRRMGLAMIVGYGGTSIFNMFIEGYFKQFIAALRIAFVEGDKKDNGGNSQ